MKLLILLIGFLISISYQPNTKCILNGEVIGDQSDTLLLYKATDFNDIIAKIPIIDNKFRFEFSFEHPEVYELIFQNERNSGSMKVYGFFAENGEIKFVLKNTDTYYDYLFSGGENNIEFSNYRKAKVKFWDEIKMYSDSLARVAQKGEEYKHVWQKLKDVPDSISLRMKEWETGFIDSTTSLLAYYKLMMKFKPDMGYCCWGEVDDNFISNAERNLNRMSAMFPNHPYEKIISTSIDKKRDLNVGGLLTDFQLTTKENKTIIASEVVAENKLVLLNFWSKYCPTCLDKNQEFVPIYNEYKAKGFEILGLTQNYKDIESLEDYIKQENNPWLDLIDHNGEKGIRADYKVSSTGGVAFLIDSHGTIIGVNLSKEQLLSKIKEYLE